MPTNAAAPPSAAALAEGEAVLQALAADDFDALPEAVARRGQQIAALVAGDLAGGADLAAAFAAQDRAIADGLRAAHARLAEALRQLSRVGHAADCYATAPPRAARLSAEG